MRFWLAGFLFLCAFIGISYKLPAQTKDVKLSGTVQDAQNKKPLESITILKKKNRRGVISNAAGQFQVMVAPGDTLIIRAIGFKTQQYVVHKQVQADFRIEILLEEGSQELPEVKVVGGLDYSKVNRALRNMKKPPEPKVAVLPPAPEPLFPVKVFTPPPATLENPISYIYDLLSKEGKDKRQLEAILEAEAQKKKALEEKRKQQAYDSLFKDRNKGFH